MTQTILIPIDLNQEAALDSVFSAATNAATTQDVSFVLMTVIPEMHGGQFPYMATDHVKKLVADAQTRLEEIGKERLGDRHPWKAEAGMGSVARTIVAQADHHEVDLIVMPSHNPGFWDIFLGSVAAQVVKHARHSVLVVRQKQGTAHA